MYHKKELCVKLVAYQMLYQDARSAKYKKQNWLDDLFKWRESHKELDF